MIEQDTIRLLRECDSGVKMGISSIEEVLDYVKSDKLKNYLIDSKHKHENITREIQELLDNCTWMRAELNGVSGYTISAGNGNRIFLPTAGYRYGTNLYANGYDACYWSTTLYENLNNALFINSRYRLLFCSTPDKFSNLTSSILVLLTKFLISLIDILDILIKSKFAILFLMDSVNVNLLNKEGSKHKIIFSHADCL